MFFRIRQIYDDMLLVNRYALEQVQQILKDQFPLISKEEIENLPAKLKNPFRLGFRPILFIADNQRGKVHGFALILHEPDLRFCYLDYISAATQSTGRGIGGALYERIRFEAQKLDTWGIFFECLPDDPQLCRDLSVLKQNISRLKFYEQYGARPIINTRYETPVKPDDDNPPYLVYDPLGKPVTIPRKKIRAIVAAILERKYHDLCSPEYNKMVIESFQDDIPILRPFQYAKQEVPLFVRIPEDQQILLVVSDQHENHYIRERGYVEAPARIPIILEELDKTGLFKREKIRHYGEQWLKSVHRSDYVDYFKRVCRILPADRPLYPYVFPIRNQTKPPKELPVRAGYYCIDTFTPLNRNAFLAAHRAVDCALAAAENLLEGAAAAYALVRPPGHHAERAVFGGFCYFNSNAIAANYLSRFGPVAILDVDYHHGNGQQDIFYRRKDVLTISIHGHPRFAYPYFSGFTEEKGEDAGVGFNFNFPLAESVTNREYLLVLKKALKIIGKFQPKFLIIALGFDTAKRDPTGTWNLKADDFFTNGYAIGALKLPTLFVQEGGYRQRNLGINARNFFSGFWKGRYQ